MLRTLALTLALSLSIVWSQAPRLCGLVVDAGGKVVAVQVCPERVLRGEGRPPGQGSR